MQSSFHVDTPAFFAGVPLPEAAGALVLLHGRRAAAEEMLPLGKAITGARQELPLAFVAPQAQGHTWYPQSFLAPRQANEPWLSAALQRVEALVGQLEDAGLARKKIVIAGFSQGACLATEFVASHPARYAGLLAFTGGLIGPLGMDLSHGGELRGTPALFMSGDPDPHVPWARVQESAEMLKRMGAQVETRRFAGRPHTISPEEIDHARRWLTDAFEGRNNPDR
jgi:predicted esterase